MCWYTVLYSMVRLCYVLEQRKAFAGASSVQVFLRLLRPVRPATGPFAWPLKPKVELHLQDKTL
jgi:hypothetical protein